MANNNEEIVIRLKPDGTREVEANGFIGKACEKATEGLLREMGKKKGNPTRKPEYNKQNPQQNREVQW